VYPSSLRALVVSSPSSASRLATSTSILRHVRGSRGTCAAAWTSSWRFPAGWTRTSSGSLSPGSRATPPTWRDMAPLPHPCVSARVAALCTSVGHGCNKKLGKRTTHVLRRACVVEGSPDFHEKGRFRPVPGPGGHGHGEAGDEQSQTYIVHDAKELKEVIKERVPGKMVNTVKSDMKQRSVTEDGGNMFKQTSRELVGTTYGTVSSLCLP